LPVQRRPGGQPDRVRVAALNLMPDGNPLSVHVKLSSSAKAGKVNDPPRLKAMRGAA